MKSNFIVTLLALWAWTLLAWWGMLMQERSNWETNWFGTQSSTNYRSLADLWLWDDFSTDGVVFEIQRNSLFKTASTLGNKVNLTKLMTTESWEQYCDKPEYKRIDQWWNQVSDCGKGILQTWVWVDGMSGLKHYLSKSNEQSIKPGSKVSWKVVIAANAKQHDGKIVWINAYSLDRFWSPLDIVTAVYTDDWVKLSLKKVTKKWISTVYQSTKKASDTSTLWIWMTNNWTLFFEVDTSIYTTNFIMNDPMYVSVNTHAQWVWINDLLFDETD